MAITRPRVKGILESILDSEVEGSRDGSVVEFCSYYLGVVDGMTDNMPPMQVTSCLYLNPKVAHESGAEWVDGESRTDKAHRLVYSSAFNHARDVVRRALEQAVLIDGAREGEVYDGGDWDHLEVFPTCEMMSRRKEEGAKESHIRHLRERTVPEMDLFLRVAGSKTELEFLQAVDGLDEEILLLLEALLSAYKEDHLLQEGLGCCPLRKDLIRWLRAVRWGDIDVSQRLVRLEAAEALPRTAGPILRQEMPGFVILLREGASPAELQAYLQETGLGPEQLGPILKLIKVL